MSKKEVKNKELPSWIKKCLKVLKPPQKLKVSEWAERYRVLDSKTSAAPGMWKNSTTPYLQGVMDAFCESEIETIVFCKPTQVGGTESLNNMIGYVISQDPAPALIVYPTLELAEYASKNRLQPMIKLSDDMANKFIESETKVLELQFEGMYIVVAGANSPASLASRPIRYLFLDEVDKYPSNAGKEADPISLAKERTKTFAANKKIFLTSTPTLKDGNVWKYMENSNEIRHYFMPCPHCGAYQEFKFKQLKWVGSDMTEAQATAYYECEHCKGKIYDSHKMQMLRAGKWEAVKKSKSKRQTAFHINTMYSPWVKFGDVAYEFLRCKDDPELLQNFVNSWLAEPWEETQLTLNSEIVFERETEYEEMVVPEWAQMLTAGVDVQKDKFYYSIRAWGANYTSQNIRHGEVFDLVDIEKIMNLEYKKASGQGLYIDLCLIDSGFRTDEVYEFCYYNAEWCTACKGSSRYDMYMKYRLSTVNKTNSKAMGMRVVEVNTNRYKDFIAARLRRENATNRMNGSFMVYKNTDKDYAEQLTAEHKVREKKNGQEVQVWKPKKAHIDNHYLDCEVYSCCAADLLNVIQLQEQPEIIQQEIHSQEKNNNNDGGWLGGGNNFLGGNKGGWL